MQLNIDSRISQDFLDSYTHFKNGSYEGYCHPAIAASLQSDRMDTLLKQERRIRIKKMKRNMILDINMPNLSVEGWEWINVKSENRITFSKSIMAVIRGSKARRAFNMACRLTRLNLDTPIPLGYIERRKKGRVIENYYLSESLNKEFNLDQFAKQGDKAEVEPFIKAVAEYANRLHNAGIMHRDLNLRNFLVHREQDTWRIALIDLNRCIRLPRLPAFMKVRDISRLYWKKFRCDFFYLYCDGRRDLLWFKWFFDFYLVYRRHLSRIKKYAL